MADRVVHGVKEADGKIKRPEQFAEEISGFENGLLVSKKEAALVLSDHQERA